MSGSGSLKFFEFFFSSLWWYYSNCDLQLCVNNMLVPLLYFIRSQLCFSIAFPFNENSGLPKKKLLHIFPQGMNIFNSQFSWLIDHVDFFACTLYCKRIKVFVKLDSKKQKKKMKMM